MDTDPMPEGNLLYPELSYQLRGCFFKVHTELGFGHKEVIYQRALEDELKKGQIPYQREAILAVKYNGKKIGEYRPDFVIDKKIIVEVKALEFLPLKLLSQLVYYLKSTEIQLGFMVNFGSTKVQIIRKIWSAYYQRQ